MPESLSNRPSQTPTRRSVLLWGLIGFAASVNAEPPSGDRSLRLIDTPHPNDHQQALASVRYLTAIALRSIPASFDGDKHWGDTKKVWAGVKMKIDGGRLKTHRRWREVEHGRWMRYELHLPPAGLALDQSVWIRDVTAIPEPAGLVSPGGSTVKRTTGHRIDATAITPAHFKVRIQRWNRGVRIASVSVEGDLKIRLDATLDVRVRPDYSEIPPAMQIDPTIKSAALSLEKFRVDRVSHLGGDAAELWGEMAQELFVERLIEKQNDRLVEKLNRGIDKNRDDLRLSTMDWIRKGFVSDR